MNEELLFDGEDFESLALHPERSKELHIRHAINKLRDELLQEYKRKPSDTDELRTMLKSVVLRLYRAKCAGLNYGVAIPSDRNQYGSKTRLGKLRFTYEKTTRIVEWLVRKEYAVVVKKGKRYLDKKDNTWKGYNTCYAATDKLIQVLKENQVRLIDFHTVIKPRSLIELRDKDKQPISCKLPDALKDSLQLLVDYNALLEKSYLDWDETIRPLGIGINKTAKTVRRVFNEAWNQGGRFHGGWWQSLRQRDKEDFVTGRGEIKTRITKNKRRPFIFINGDITTEIDFKCMHAMLIYMLAGKDFRLNAAKTFKGHDIYRSVRFSSDADKDRNLVKSALLIGFNCVNDTETYRALRSEIFEDIDNYPFGKDSVLGEKLTKDVLINQVCGKIISQHPPLKDWLYQGRGRELQYHDSTIAEHVIRRFTYELEVPCLSMHDSMVVPAINARSLAYAMHEGIVQFAKNHGSEFDYELEDMLDLGNAVAAHEKARIFDMTKGGLIMDEDEGKTISQEEWFELIDMPLKKSPIWKRIKSWKEDSNPVPFDLY